MANTLALGASARKSLGVQVSPSAQRNLGSNEGVKIFKNQGLKTGDLNWERGRENGSFPVAEILKPMGFKAQSR